MFAGTSLSYKTGYHIILLASESRNFKKPKESCIFEFYKNFQNMRLSGETKITINLLILDLVPRWLFDNYTNTHLSNKAKPANKNIWEYK